MDSNHKRHIKLQQVCHRPKTLNIPLFYYKSMRKINIEKIGGDISEDIERGDLKNCLQLLYLIHKTKSVCKGPLGITKTQKLCFLTEFSQRSKGFNGFDFNFFRWNYGPMAVDIYRLIEMLKNVEMIHKGKIGDFPVTEGGLKLLEIFNPVFEENADVLRETEKTVEEFGGMSAGSLKEYIYDTFWFGGIPLRDVEFGTNLFIPLSKRKRDFVIPEEWLETLEIYLDKGLYEGLKQALKNARAGKSERW